MLYPFVFGILAFVVSLIFFIGVLFALPNFLRFRNLEIMPVNKLRQGYYAVEGTVLPMELTKSPVSNRFCVYCNYMIQWYKGGKGAHWVTEVNMTRLKRFLVMDVTGEVMVDPSKAVMDKPFKVAATQVRGRFRDLIEEHNVKTTNWIGFQRRMRCMERRLEPDDRLTIIGTVTKDLGVPTPTNLLMGTGNSRKKFLISSKPFEKMKYNAKAVYWGLLITGAVFLGISLVLLFVGIVF